MAILGAADNVGRSAAQSTARRLAALQQAVREAEAVAAAQRSVPLVPSAAPSPQAARVAIGNTASAALGDDIPRPRPATEPLGTPSAGALVELPGGPAPNKARIAALLAKWQQGGPESLDVLEALELVSAGAEPELLFAGRLSESQAKVLLRRVAVEGVESLSPEEAAALKRTPGVAAMPETAAAIPDGDVAPVSGSSGLDDLTDTAAADADNLAASGIDLSPERNPNLTPNTVKPNKIESLAQRIRQATTQADAEPVAGLKRLQAEVNRLSPEAKQALLEHPALAEGIESARAKTDPDARAEAIANAQARLTALENLSGVSTTDRAAEQIANAADARATASAVREGAARPVMPQGSRQLDVATEDLPDYEQPTMYDVAAALARENAERADRQAPLGGLSQDERKAISVLNGLGSPEEGKEFADAPIALQGRDRASTPFDSRTIGYRLTDTNDIRAIKRVLEEGVPAKWATGRQAWTDSWLNKAGRQETYDNLLATVVGSRPSNGRLTRTRPDMTPAERQLQEADIIRTFGEQDASELLPDAGDDDLAELGQDGRRGRLGGAQQASRVQGALRNLFGDVNPLELMDVDGGVVFASPQDVAQELLSRNTLVKPGTPSWDYAVEKLSNAIDDAYSPRTAATTGVKKAEMAAADAAPSGNPAGDFGDRGTSLDVDALPERQKTPNDVANELVDFYNAADPGTPEYDKLAASVASDQAPQRVGQGNAIDIPEPAASPRDFSQPPTEDTDLTSFPNRGQRKPVVPVDDADGSASLDASATDIGDVSGESGLDATTKPQGSTTPPEKTGSAKINPVEGSANTEDIVAQIQAEAEEIFRQAIDSGMGRKRANAARKEFVDREMVARGVRKTSGASGTDGTAPKPDGKDTINQVDGDAGTGASPQKPKKTKKTKPEDAATEGSDPSKSADAAGTQPNPSTPNPPPKQGWLGWAIKRAIPIGTAVGTGLYVGGSLLNSIGGKVNLDDIPLPPGGLGGGDGVDAIPVHLPVGNQSVAAGGASLDDPAAAEAAIQQALDRIRGSRGGPSPGYQTLQNYNVWR